MTIAVPIVLPVVLAIAVILTIPPVRLVWRHVMTRVHAILDRRRQCYSPIPAITLVRVRPEPIPRNETTARLRRILESTTITQLEGAIREKKAILAEHASAHWVRIGIVVVFAIELASAWNVCAILGVTGWIKPALSILLGGALLALARHVAAAAQNTGRRVGFWLSLAGLCSVILALSILRVSNEVAAGAENPIELFAEAIILAVATAGSPLLLEPLLATWLRIRTDHNTLRNLERELRKTRTERDEATTYFLRKTREFEDWSRVSKRTLAIYTRWNRPSPAEVALHDLTAPVWWQEWQADLLNQPSTKILTHTMAATLATTNNDGEPATIPTNDTTIPGITLPPNDPTTPARLAITNPYQQHTTTSGDWQ